MKIESRVFCCLMAYLVVSLMVREIRKAGSKHGPRQMLDLLEQVRLASYVEERGKRRPGRPAVTTRLEDCDEEAMRLFRMFDAEGWPALPFTPSFYHKGFRQWNDLQLALNIMSDAEASEAHDALLKQVSAAAMRETKVWSDYEQRLISERKDIASALGDLRIRRFLDRCLGIGQMCLSAFCVLFSLWAGWLAAGAFPSYRLLAFAARAIDIYGILLCIGLVYLPHGLVLILLSQIWRFVTYKTAWGKAYDSPRRTTI